MKKLLLLFAITSVSIIANAQCTPDPAYTQPGVYPDSATGFIPACVGEYYEQVVTNVVPADTDAVIIPGLPPVTIAFDSVVISSFTGLPASMSYQCVSSLGGCAFAGGETGCILISGTPTAGEEGNYTLTIVVDVYLGGDPNPLVTETVDWYVIKVLAAGNCNAGLNNNSEENITLYPNPTDGLLKIEGLNYSSNTISILDINGKLINQYPDIKTRSFDVNVESLENGVYFVKVDNINSSKTIRFTKK